MSRSIRVMGYKLTMTEKDKHVNSTLNTNSIFVQCQ